MKIKVTHQPGEEDSMFPVWIAKSREEIGLQQDVRAHKNRIKSELKLGRTIKEINDHEYKKVRVLVNLDDSDNAYQQAKDNEASFDGCEG